MNNLIGIAIRVTGVEYIDVSESQFRLKCFIKDTCTANRSRDGNK